MLPACSESPKPAEARKEPEKAAEPITARRAFQQMYITARGWAADAQGLRCRNVPLAEVKAAEPGKAGAWECTFVSPSQQKMKTYTYSIVEAAGNLHTGVFGNVPENWGGSRPNAQPWTVAAFKIDSNAAYETALKKSAAYVKKNPDKPVMFLLEQTSRHPYLTWRVIWGESISTSNYSVYVNASTGDYLETMR